MTSPFGNDPFALVYMAFKNLYPDKDCVCYFDVIDEKTENGEDIFGETWFHDDGHDDGAVYVFIDSRLKITDAIEIFAHELAHVAVGNEANHGKEWEDAFDAIFTEYNKLGYELFDKHDDVEAIDGNCLSELP